MIIFLNFFPLVRLVLIRQGHAKYDEPFVIVTLTIRNLVEKKDGLEIFHILLMQPEIVRPSI